MCQSLGCPCCGNWPAADRRGVATTTTARTIAWSEQPNEPCGRYDCNAWSHPAGFVHGDKAVSE